MVASLCTIGKYNALFFYVASICILNFWNPNLGVADYYKLLFLIIEDSPISI